MRLPSWRAWFWIAFLLFNFNALYKSSTGENFKISRKVLAPLQVKICAVIGCETIDAIKNAKSEFEAPPLPDMEKVAKQPEPIKVVVHEEYEDKVPETLELVEMAQNFLIGMTNSLQRESVFMPPSPAVFHDGDLGLKIQDYAEGKYYMRRLCKGLGVCFEHRESVAHWGDIVNVLLLARHMAGAGFPGGPATLLSQWETTKNFFSPKTIEILSAKGLKWPLTYQLEQNRVLLTLIHTLGATAVGLPSIETSIETSIEGLTKKLETEVGSHGVKQIHFAIAEELGLTEREVNDKYHLAIMAHGRVLQLMLEWNQLNPKNQFSSEILAGISQFLLDYKNKIFWQGREPAVAGHPFVAHLGARLEAVLALLKYAEAEKLNPSFKSEILHFAKNYFEEVKKQTQGDTLGLFGDVANLGRMVRIALKLTEQKAGFYYADVERWLRNQLVESQIDRRMSQEISAKTSQEEAFDKVNERVIGTFLTDATHAFVIPKNYNFRWQIETQSSAMAAIYDIWRAQVKLNSGELRINFLLNRAHEYADIHSLLPYYGVVRIKIKKSFTLPTDLFLRLPPWMVGHTEKLLLYRAGKSTPVQVVEEQYIMVKNLQKGELLQFNFPLSVTIENVVVQRAPASWWYEGIEAASDTKPLTTYQVKMRGDTAVEVSPLPTGGASLYRRAHIANFSQGPAPERRVLRSLQSLEP